MLNDGGVVAMVVPSSFLSKPMNYAKMEIIKSAELVDAYRLPEGTFQNTNVGTDIVIFKKTSRGTENFANDKRFEQHPEKIL